MLLEKHHATPLFGRFFLTAEYEIESNALQKEQREDDKSDRENTHAYSILCHMLIHETLKKSIPDAMRAHDAVRLQTLRSLITMMTNEVVAKKRKPDEFLTDEEALAVIKRAANQRKDSIEQCEKGGRPELAVSEKAELVIIEAYLPAMMSREEIEAVVKAKMTELGVSSEADAAKTPEGRSPGASLEALRGKLTGTLMKELKGKADGGDVKAVVDKLLS